MGIFGCFKPNVEKMKRKGDLKGLITALGYENSAEIRGQAATALGNLRDARAVEPLAAAMTDSDSDVQLKARQALAEIGVPSIRALVRRMKEEDGEIRLAATETLGNIANPDLGQTLAAALTTDPGRDETVLLLRSAVNALVALLDDPEPRVRIAAIRVLGRVNHPRVVEILIELLREEPGDAPLAAATALANLRDPNALGPVLDVLRDEDVSVRRFAEVVLRMGVELRKRADTADDEAVMMMLMLLHQGRMEVFDRNPVKWRNWWTENGQLLPSPPEWIARARQNGF